MAKRFIDTGKYRKAWFRKLDPQLKCAWDFLLSECDIAGVWDVDMDQLCFSVGGPKMELGDLLQVFGDRIRELPDDKLWVVGFVDFQYGELSQTVRPHRAVIKRLTQLGLKGYRKGIERVSGTPDTLSETSERDKDKDQDQDKDKDKDQDQDQDQDGAGQKVLHPVDPTLLAHSPNPVVVERLRLVTAKTQSLWLEQYCHSGRGAPWICQQLLEAIVWADNDARQPIRAWGSFFSRWLKNAARDAALNRAKDPPVEIDFDKVFDKTRRSSTEHGLGDDEAPKAMPGDS